MSQVLQNYYLLILLDFLHFFNGYFNKMSVYFLARNLLRYLRQSFAYLGCLTVMTKLQRLLKAILKNEMSW